ncbi:hypothetical protein RB595_004907 [Gaeumannomyces hyphopodioides]
MPVFTPRPRLFLRDVSTTTIGSSGNSSETPSQDHNVSLGLETESHPRGTLNHLLCTHIYAVALIALLAAVVAVRFSLFSRLASAGRLKGRTVPSPPCAGSRPTSLGLTTPATSAKAESGCGCRGGGCEKEGISSGQPSEWSSWSIFEPSSLARRAGGFGESTVPRAPLSPPQQRQKQQQQRQPQDQGSRHHRASWEMVDARSRGVSTKEDGARSGVHLSQTRSGAAAAEKGAGQPYRVSPPNPSFFSQSQATHEPNVGPQDVSAMESGDSWSGASALDARASQQTRSGDSSTALWGGNSATATRDMPATISLASASRSVAAGLDPAAGVTQDSFGSTCDSDFGPVQLGQATPQQFGGAPPPPDPTSHFPTVFAFQDRRPTYAASIPPGLDGGDAGLSFIHQPNPDYMSAGMPSMGQPSDTASFSRQSSSSTSAGFSTEGSHTERWTPHGRSYNRMVSSGSESDAAAATYGTSGGDAGYGDMQQQWQTSGFSTYQSLQHFAPLSFPATDATYLPPPPPGSGDYGRDTTFFDRHYQQYHQPPAQQHHGRYDATGLPSHHEQEQGHGGMGAHGETTSMDDESGASWKRHTRVHDGGVCLACLANGGGFYGDTVPLEERRPR